jgi:hypothetical protein
MRTPEGASIAIFITQPPLKGFLTTLNINLDGGIDLQSYDHYDNCPQIAGLKGEDDIVRFPSGAEIDVTFPRESQRGTVLAYTCDIPVKPSRDVGLNGSLYALQVVSIPV